MNCEEADGGGRAEPYVCTYALLHTFHKVKELTTTFDVFSRKWKKKKASFKLTHLNQTQGK